MAPNICGFSCRPDKPNELDRLATVRVTIQDQPFQLWIAKERDDIEHGLMGVTAEQMAPLPDATKRGMIFVFEAQRPLNFWMKDTIIPLDVVFLTTDGRVVGMHTMASLDERLNQYPSTEPARFAIEVNANVLFRLGLSNGDHIEIPDSVLKPTH